jgi:two-component system, sensor histidine kinase and response regulator
VLVVDSDPTRLRTTAELLGASFKVKVATQAGRALVLCQTENAPDMVLIDTELSGHDGFDLAKRLRQHPQSEHLPVVLVAPAGLPDVANRALEAGALACLSHPVAPASLMQLLGTVARCLRAAPTPAAPDPALGQLLETDLLTPLASGLSLLEPLLQDDSLMAQQGDALNALECGLLDAIDAQHLSMVLMRIERGQFTVRPRAVPLRRVLERVVRHAKERFLHKALQIELTTPGPLSGAQALKASGDALLCHTLLLGLLRHCCEGAGNGSAVTIHVDAMGADAYQVRLSRSGLVPEAQQRTMFQKSPGADVQCYGAKQLALAQHGDVTMELDAQSQRTALVVRLLRAQQSV